MNNPIEHLPETRAHRFEFDTRAGSPSVTVTQAIAEIEEVDVTAIDGLYDSVDPDAIDHIMASALRGEIGDIRVRFSIDEYRITIHSYGIIRIEPLDGGEETGRG